ncbi:MAG TPA: hypothetical protein PLH00_06840 [Bacteroidaceae bacterium]|nr:hypothetical protein [Bacteroidaceae bacterium]
MLWRLIKILISSAVKRGSIGPSAMTISIKTALETVQTSIIINIMNHFISCLPQVSLFLLAIHTLMMFSGNLYNFIA